MTTPPPSPVPPPRTPGPGITVTGLIALVVLLLCAWGCGFVSAVIGLTR